MRILRLCSIVAFAALMLCVPLSARADLSPPKDVDAKRLLLVGNTLYRLKEFKRAIDKYKQGAKIEDAPVFYYNIGQCLRQWKKYKAAVWFYRRYLSRGNVRSQVAKVVRMFIRDMRRELKKAASTAPPTEVAGGNKVSKSGKGTVTRVKPGPSMLGKRVRRLHKPAAWYRDWLGWGIVSVGVASGIAGFGMFAGATTFDTKADRETDQLLRDQYRAAAESRRGWGTALTITSGVAVISGIVKLLIRPGAPQERSSLTLHIRPRGALLSGRF